DHNRAGWARSHAVRASHLVPSVRLAGEIPKPVSCFAPWNIVASALDLVGSHFTLLFLSSLGQLFALAPVGSVQAVTAFSLCWRCCALGFVCSRLLFRGHFSAV